MHSGIRLILFLIYATAIALGSATQLVLGALLLIASALIARWLPSRRTWQLLMRLRWFLLSIALLYLLYTPGVAIIPDWEMPTWQGLTRALEQASVLLLLLLAAQLLQATTPRDQLAFALIWLLHPLARVGFPVERFAVRLILIIDLLPDSAEQLRPLPRVREAISHLAAHLQAIEQRAESEPDRKIELPNPSPPTLLQWLGVGALAVVFYLTPALSW